MKNKKMLRRAATQNGARFTSLRIILADKKFRDKFYLAAMRGAFAGGIMAMLIGILLMGTSILEGIIVTSVGIIWSALFYFLNPDDIVFRG